MALTIAGLPDGRWYLGPSLQVKLIQCTPAVSDYPTGGGWSISAEQCEFGNGHIYGASLLAQQYVASSSPDFVVNLPSSSFGTNPMPSTTTFNVSAYVQGTSLYGNAPEAPNNTDFSGYPFWLLVYGY